MSKTNIEWTEYTWNPIVGCTKVSAGCKNCYAEKTAHRFSEQEGVFKGTTDDKGHWTGRININEKALLAPLKRKKPTIYFVNSMSDLFHPNVPFEVVDKIMAIIALCPQHTFQVLTKRPERMKQYFDEKRQIKFYLGDMSEAYHFYRKVYKTAKVENFINNKIVKRLHNDGSLYSDNEFIYNNILPLPNLWLGVSVENQETADTRIPMLLDIPAKVRFLSCEPLLSAIDFNKIDPDEFGLCCNPLKGTWEGNDDGLQSKIDWVIVGGESGHNARPLHPDWVRSIKNQCESADIPFFFKQWGECNELGEKVGKKMSGALLDGVTYKQFPKE